MQHGFWTALAAAVRRGLAPVLPAGLLEGMRAAPTGSTLAFVRDAGRMLRGSLRRLLRGGGLAFLGRIEVAFLASGAAAQLADAALEGEGTRELAARIARIARSLSGAVGAAVHLRSPAGLQLLGADGAACDGSLAERAYAGGIVAVAHSAAAVPLRVRDSVVGTLSLHFDGGLRDLAPLQPLLTRAGAVIAAAEREARKDRFLSLAAHELKTPLTSIKGFSYSLARRLERGEAFDPRHVQVLERQAEKLHALLEEMLEVSRLETGRFILHQEPCETTDLVEASLRSLRRLGADKNLDWDLEASLPLVADRERIERALTAMVLRARALGGEVRIRARRQDGRAQLRVSWTGKALSPEERATAFHPRWEVPQAQRQGLGMALLVARETAALHGGTLEAEENALVLQLPLRAHQVQRDADPGRRRVLVVDDDEAIARMMSEFLAEQGFVSDWAGGGSIALEKVKAQPPDLIVLDLNMPDLDGRGLLSAVRALRLGPRVVLLSADRDVATAARDLACEAFVEKPFAPDGLLAAVRRALGVEPLAK